MTEPLVILYDTETNGLLVPQEGKTVATKMHSMGLYDVGADQYYSCCNYPWFVQGVYDDVLPSGNVLKNVQHRTMEFGLKLLEKADIRVAHNAVGFDERIIKKFNKWWKPKGRAFDTVIISRILYPQIWKQGPNTHKVPGALVTRHSLEAWGYRLGERKNKAFDPGDWQTWSLEGQLYMMQDIVSLKMLWRWLMYQKPEPRAIEDEQAFAAIMSRQEVWGFTFDYEKALSLQALVVDRVNSLEAELIETYGEWWAPKEPEVVKSTRQVKMPEFPDVTMKRFSEKTGKELRPYVGPPLCSYEKGARFTPITRVQFKPSSRDHVRLMLFQRHGWKPTKKTKKGTYVIDDEVLRQLPFPEAAKLADFYAANKIRGYVSSGNGAWLGLAQEEGQEWRMHGRVNTIGTYTYRPSFFNPNMGQIPTRDPEYGPRCRQLFRCRSGFKLVGHDGSGMQLRILAHYLAKGGRWPNGERWGDGGRYAQVFIDGQDPHEFLRDAIGTDIMGEGKEGRDHGKTCNYAMPFGAGWPKLGSIIDPLASPKRKIELGNLVQERLAPVFGEAFDDLKQALRDKVERDHFITGLDGRKLWVPSPHVALSTLLQAGEVVVMKKSLILLDEALKEKGARPGVTPWGEIQVEDADYEFCANVYDEAQADVREELLPTYQQLAAWSVPEAGRLLGLKCPLKADVKVGDDWAATH